MEVLKRLGVACLIVFLLGSAAGFSQITSANEAYKMLDLYQLEPTPQTSTAFGNALQQWNPINEEEKMAKVVSLCNLGYYQQQFSQLPEAIGSYEMAKQLFGSNSLAVYDMVNSCYIPLGNLYTQTNALSEAENTIKDYILVAQQEGWSTEEVIGLRNLSIVFYSKGSFNKAIAVLKRGLAIAPNNQGLKLELANNYLASGDVKTAEKWANEFLSATSNDPMALQLLAKIQLKRGQPQRALSSLDKVLQIFQNKKNTPPRDLAKLYLAMAQIQMSFQQTSDVKVVLKKLFSVLIPGFSEGQDIPSEQQLYPENTLMDALDLQAEVLTLQEDFRGAYTAYKRAFEVQDLLNAGTVLQDSKLLQQTRQKSRSERSLRLLFHLHMEGESGTFWLSEAVWVDDRSKSPVLQEARLLQRLLEADTSQLGQKITLAKQQLMKLQTQIERESQSGIFNAAQLGLLQANYNKVIAEQRKLTKAFKEKYPDKFTKRTIDISTLQAMAAENDETVVSYFVGEQTVFQLSISKEKTSFVQLFDSKETRDGFMKTCVEFNHFFDGPTVINNDPNLFAQKAYELYQQFELPLAEKVVVIPDGILSFVPIGALLSSSVNTSVFEQMPFVLKDTQVSYKLSFSSHSEKGEPIKIEPTVLGVFPVFKQSSRELSYSVREAKAIEEAVPSKMLLENEATTARFLNELGPYNTLHISTHASGGTFTEPAAIEFADRTLSIDELYGYQFNKDLVVLSACETGVGKVLKGEGALSLARAFQYAGATNVLFSQWKVNDLSTAQLMQGFYESYAKSGAKNYALHTAQLNYLSNPAIDNTKKSPYYWAGFVYYGETSDPVSFPYRWLMGVGCIVLILGLFFLRKKKLKT